jgi:hypothetical protein
MAKFQKTTIFTGSEAPQPGQWVKTEMGARGQYLGRTDSGCIVIRWQHSGNFAKRDALNNKHLRQFALTYGSK